MEWKDRSARRLILLFPLLTLWGCVEYRIETTLASDGSGVRSERIEVDESGESDFRPSSRDFKALMNVSEVNGWVHTLEGKDDEDVHVFTRETRVKGLDDWADLSGHMNISGVAERQEGQRRTGIMVGDRDYATVGFSNSVQVESGRGETGPTYTYREKFSWRNLMGALVDFELDEFKSMLASRYPDLDPEIRGEVVGLVKGGLWSTAENGRWDMSEQERARAFESLIEHLTFESLRLVRVQYPDADKSFFADAYQHLFLDARDDLDEPFEEFLEEMLPGVLLAGNSEIVYRLNMPGRVVDSNAHERDGTTLVWKFSPWDAILSPVEIHARSQVER
jgi:hypothetical protein